jgi:glycosyltransferase involved in cell wall biosynthesis
MKIAFHSNQLGVRGTEIALYEYAFYNREILGNKSIIVSDRNQDMSAYEKFNREFEVILYDRFEEVIPILHSKRIDIAYFQKSGQYDGKLIPDIKNVVHSIFQFKQPHGDVYSYISHWLSEKMSGGEFPYVPYMVDILKHDHQMNYRDFFGIPKDAFVFGYYGGPTSFNIEFAKRAVIDVAEKYKDIYFIFMNSVPFCDGMDNVIFLDATTDMEKKIGFINTCDACLHARNGGESFGLTVAEFSIKNKPVFTTTYCTDPLCDGAHIEMLGDKSVLYSDYDDLVYKLLNAKEVIHSKNDWNAYSEYTPDNVMNIFKNVFLG